MSRSSTLAPTSDIRPLLFANVLVDANESNDVFPRDFLISLGKPPNYFGAEELFGRDRVGALKARDGIRVIRMIPLDDELIFSSKNLKKVLEAEDDSLFTASIKEAIYCFIVACAARIARGQHKKHMTMLLHVSHLTEVQAKLQAEVDAHLTAIKFSADPGLRRAERERGPD